MSVIQDSELILETFYKLRLVLEKRSNFRLVSFYPDSTIVEGSFVFSSSLLVCVVCFLRRETVYKDSYFTSGRIVVRYPQKSEYSIHNFLNLTHMVRRSFETGYLVEVHICFPPLHYSGKGKVINPFLEDSSSGYSFLLQLVPV